MKMKDCAPLERSEFLGQRICLRKRQMWMISKRRRTPPLEEHITSSICRLCFSVEIPHLDLRGDRTPSIMNSQLSKYFWLLWYFSVSSAWRFAPRNFSAIAPANCPPHRISRHLVMLPLPPIHQHSAMHLLLRMHQSRPVPLYYQIHLLRS